MAGTAAQRVIEPAAAGDGPATPLQFRPARPDDDAELRRLLRENPMDGRIAVALEREPSFFAARAIEGDRHDTIVASLPSGRVVAMGDRSVRRVFLDGQVARLGYLSQLRVDRGWRGRRRVLVEGFAAARAAWAARDPDELPFDLTSIMLDNRPARRLLARGLPGLPRYREYAAFTTLLLPVRGSVRRRRLPGIDNDRATEDHLDRIVECLARNNRRHQLAPAWTADDLRCARRTRGLRLSDFLVAVAGSRVVGCLALWDQRRFKQAVVRRYGPALRRWRRPWNAIAPLLGAVELPEEGKPMASAFLSHVAVDGDDPQVLLSLIDHARRDARALGVTSLCIGMADAHPLMRAVQQACRHRAYRSMLYLVWWGNEAIAPAAGNGRIPHVEVALL
jgi:hypothetical protein